MGAPDSPRASEDVESADWIRARLRAPEQHVAASIIPDGFDAYVRVLHPAQIPSDDRRLVRWAEVARWADRAWHSRVQWHDVALPRATPPTETPWRGGGPREGSPWINDVRALVEVLADATTTPTRCYFGVWDGWASETVGYHSLDQRPTVTRAPSVPARRVSLPWREYVLYEGPITSVETFASSTRTRGQIPNLWWPEDRAWCVASEVDLLWTYVGASQATIDRLMDDERLEVLVAQADDSCLSAVSGWLAELVDVATEEVMSTGSATLSLTLGTVDVTLSEGQEDRVVRTRSTRLGGHSSSDSRVQGGPLNTRDQVRSRIEQTVIALTRHQ